jgi:bacterioferritin-associated ferredoxin
MSRFNKKVKRLKKVRAAVEGGSAVCESLTDDGLCGQKATGWIYSAEAVGHLAGLLGVAAVCGSCLEKAQASGSFSTSKSPAGCTVLMSK